MTNSDNPPTVAIYASGQEAADARLGEGAAIPERNTDRPAWMADVEEKAEFYADAWGLKPGQVKVALHDIFSMLFLHGAGPYEEVHCSKQIGELAKVLMDEFGGPTRDEGAIDMAIRLLREGKGH
jgi:hypothetical protein